MRFGRLTIAGMLVLCGLAALAAAALRSPTPLMTQLAVTAALTCLLIAAVGSLTDCRGRPFAIGFSAVGWGYLFLALGPWCDQHVSPWLLSTRIADEIYLRAVAPDPVYAGRLVLTEAETSWNLQAIERMGEFRLARHRRIAHSVFSIAHGAFGGVLGLAFSRRRRESPP